MSQNITDNKAFIQEAIELFNNLNIQFRNVFSDSENENSENIYSFKIEVEKIISLLFESVIRGEYFTYKQFKSFFNSISKYEDEINSNNIRGKINDVQIEILEEVGEDILMINKILSKYLEFSKEVEYLTTKDDNIFVRSFDEGIDKKEYNLFLLNLDLCIYDILLEENKSSAKNLEEIKKYIERFSVPYLNIQEKKMLKKANFLLFKWYKRAELNQKDISPIIDGEERGDYEKIIISYGEKWESVVKYINNHYFEGTERELRKYFQNIKNKKIEDYFCQDIHFYIKYYKDIDVNLSKLDEIISFLKCKAEDNIYPVILQYAINNRFSLFLKQCSDKDKIYEEYQKIKGDYKNYFPQYKFVDTITIIINNHLQKENISLDEVKELEYFIKEKLEPEYQKYKANMEWSSQHTNFIFRVDYEECVIDNIFIYSSFVLPAPNKEAHDKYEKVSSDYQTLKTQIEPLKRIKEVLLESQKIKDELIKDNEKTKKDLEKGNVKIIELMGLFSATIAFIMSSVSGFKFIEGIFSAVLFLLIFSTALISFLLILLLITRHNENLIRSHKCKIKYFYIVKLILICFMSIGVTQCEKEISEEKNNLNNINIDSGVDVKDNKKDTIITTPKKIENSSKAVRK